LWGSEKAMPACPLLGAGRCALSQRVGASARARAVTTRACAGPGCAHARQAAREPAREVPAQRARAPAARPCARRIRAGAPLCARPPLRARPPPPVLGPRSRPLQHCSGREPGTVRSLKSPCCPGLVRSAIPGAISAAAAAQASSAGWRARAPTGPARVPVSDAVAALSRRRLPGRRCPAAGRAALYTRGRKPGLKRAHADTLSQTLVRRATRRRSTWLRTGWRRPSRCRCCAWARCSWRRR